MTKVNPKKSFFPIFLLPNKEFLKPCFLYNYTISRGKSHDFLHIYYFCPPYIHYYNWQIARKLSIIITKEIPKHSIYLLMIVYHSIPYIEFTLSYNELFHIFISTRL